MKRLTVISLIVFLGLQANFLRAETKSAKPVANTAEKSKPANQAVVDANKVADANQAASEPNEADEMEKEFDKANKTTDRELQEVMKRNTENRVKMLEAMQKQAVADLMFIRGLAEEEKASKTVKAIDLAIEKRKERYEQMMQEAKERQEKDAARAEKAKEQQKRKRKMQ